MRFFSSAFVCHLMSFCLFLLSFAFFTGCSIMRGFACCNRWSPVSLPADELAGDLRASQDYCSFFSSHNNQRWFDWPQTCKLAASAATQTLSNWITSEVSFTSVVGFTRQIPCKGWDYHSYVPDIFISWWVTGRPEHLLNMDWGIYICCCCCCC